MKEKIFISGVILFMLTSTLMAQNVYYVSSSEGNDENPGNSLEQPWQSLTKVNNFIPTPGDQILFRSGDSWDGSLIIPAAGVEGNLITYGAYGTGEKPVIYGSEVITGWTLSSSNIYKAQFPKPIKELFLDGNKMKVARYPNSGYAKVSGVPTTKSITCNALDDSIDYSGAGLAIRTIAYALETHTVRSSTGKTITLRETPAFALSSKQGQGFILVNKLEFLDSPGEWFYEKATKTLYFRTPDGDSPENYVVRGAVQEYGVRLEESFVGINNLNIKQCSNSGIRLTGSGCILDNNIIEDSDIQGIQIVFGTHNVISNNVIKRCNQFGLYSYTAAASSNTVITDNDISDVMVFDELGISLTGYWFSGSGMYVEGPGNIVQYNKLVNLGYNGIQFSSTNKIQYNYIKDACKVKDDGGGIYTATGAAFPNATNKGSVIQYNIIDGVTGTTEGWSGWYYTFGEGIYLDEITGFVTANNNTVANCTSNGIFLHNSYHDTIMHNTVFNCNQLLRSGTSKGTSVFKYNIAYALDKDPQNANTALNTYESRAKDTWDFNRYINHYNTDVFKKESKVYDFDGWKAVTGQDANSTFDGSPLATSETEKLFYNETKQTKVFDLENIIYRDIDGNLVSNSILLEPFTSKILIKTNLTNVGNVENRDIFVYPNPTNGMVYVKTDVLLVDDCEISLYNLMGKQVLFQNFNSSAGKLEETINISHLSEGIYVIHLKSGLQKYQNKIVVNK